MKFYIKFLLLGVLFVCCMNDCLAMKKPQPIQKQLGALKVSLVDLRGTLDMMQGNLGALSGALGGGLLTEVDYKGEINNILDFSLDDARIEKLIEGNKEHLAAAIRYLDGYPNLVVDLIDRINKIRKLREYAPLTESDTNPWYEIENKIVGWVVHDHKKLVSGDPKDNADPNYTKYNFTIQGHTVNAKFILFEIASNQGDAALDVVQYLLANWPDLVNEKKNVKGSDKTAYDIAKYNLNQKKLECTQLLVFLEDVYNKFKHFASPQPQVSNPWQQIFDFLQQYNKPTAEKEPSNPGMYQEMYNAIQNGSLDKVKLLINEFGSSSKKYGKKHPKSFFVLAQNALQQHPSAGVPPHPVPHPQPMGLAPIPHNQPYTVCYWDKGVKKSKIFNCISWLNANKSLRDMVYDDGGNQLWNTVTPPIRFYFPVNPNIKKSQSPDFYGNYFSNYSNHPVIIDGESFPTTEHYFQAQKVKCAATGNHLTDYAKILGDADPDEAKRIARNYNDDAGKHGWHTIKRNIMKKAIDAKVDQHSDVKQQLLGTGDALLLEYTVLYNDTEWGIGTDGTGSNLLGIFLMEKRAKLKKAGN